MSTSLLSPVVRLSVITVVLVSRYDGTQAPLKIVFHMESH
jgi:hypothetical protein